MATPAMPPLTTAAKLLLSSLSAVYLLFLLVLSSRRHPAHQRPFRQSSRLALATASPHCDGVLYPSLCASIVSALPDSGAHLGPREVTLVVVSRAAAAVRASASNCSSYLLYPDRLSPRVRLALADCVDLHKNTLAQLTAANADLHGAADSAGVATVLSAAMTNQYTCLDGVSAAVSASPGRVRPYIQNRIFHTAHLLSNSLAMVKKLPRKIKNSRQLQQEEMFDGYGPIDGGFPLWLSRRDRRLLDAPASEIAADLVVAKDGSGNFTTVSDALAAAPNNSNMRFVIYIKAGGYFENVEVGSEKTNIVFVGDGMWNTVIKAGRNFVDGWTTFRSATLAVVGNGFLARDITVENSAGASKHQAVALRVGADFTAFYRCSFAGFQDTLYVHSLRQFYRECDIYGTVDFIFGDAAVVFQACNLYARRPGPNQKNVFTAQGRQDPNQNTGIAIQRCKMAAAADLLPVQTNFSTFLGRPWKEYSRTVIMQSQLDDLISQRGWLEWNGTFALDTLYYAEYMNYGAGADTGGRVGWPGYRVINSSDEASNFTVAAFIQGDQWLGSTSVPFLLGLS